MTLPAWIVMNGHKPRWLFRFLRVSAGPTMCRVTLKPKKAKA